MSHSGSPPMPLSGSNGFSTLAHQGSVSLGQTRQSPFRGLEERLTAYLQDKEEPFQVFSLGKDRTGGARNKIYDFERYFSAATSQRVVPSLPSESTSPTPVNRARTYKDLVADPTEFAHHWEKKVVPYLVQTILEHLDVLSVTVARVASGDRNDVIFITRPTLADSRKKALQDFVLGALPEHFGNILNFRFSPGAVVAAQAQDDRFCREKNPLWHRTPMMGDSAGVDYKPDGEPDYEQSGGTLGVLLQVDDVGYWVVNCHILPEDIEDIEDSKRSAIQLHQPSIPDYNDTYGEDAGPGSNILGTLVSWSGKPFETIRKSLHSFGNNEEHYVVTDWAIFRASDVQNNRIRIPDNEDGDGNPIKFSSYVIPGKEVKVSGRTSGLTKAFISLVPSIVLPEWRNRVQEGDSHFFQHGNSTGVLTREWAICHNTTDTYDRNYYAYVTDGAGIPGDSGSPIIDANNNKYYGILWGRNEYSNSDVLDNDGQVQEIVHIPRISYFTTCDDLCDDIQEKMGSRARPMLPNIGVDDRLSNIDPPRRSSAVLRPRPKQSVPESIRKMLSAAASPASNALHVPASLPVRI